jgi:SAM-dependent methyltransferase
MATTTLKPEWEAAEIARSRVEAGLTGDSRLVATAANIVRYMDPPIDTAFPLEYAYALLGDVHGLRVLDFGCGSGENSFLLARRGADVIGVDISASLIALARRRLDINGAGGTASFVVGSAHDLPLPDNAVDVVFGIAILHHLDLAASSREVHRVLKPGGRAIFQEPVRDSTVLRALRACIPYHAPDISPFERPLRTAELRAFAQPFTRCTTRAFSLPFVNICQAIPSLRPCLSAAYRQDADLLRRVPALRHLAGIRILELVK